MRDPFQRLQDCLFARRGKQAFLRGVETRAILTDGVATYGEYGQVAAYRSTASLPVADQPKGGDPLIVEGRSFFVDQILSSDGYETIVMLREQKP